jgi:hypothetical protein
MISSIKQFVDWLSGIYLFVLDGAGDGGLTGEIESHNWSHFVCSVEDVE